MKFEYSLYQVRPQIYLLETDSKYDIAMTFWRSQEFYESPNTNFRGKNFSLLEYMDWYAKTCSGIESFSYSNDYIGYNVPGEVIMKCYTVNEERTPYDKFMLSIVRDIFFDQDGGKFYLIGAHKGDSKTINHELAHAFFYVDNEYREHTTQLVNDIPSKKDIFTTLTDEFLYDKSVLVDETQAFMSTGLVSTLRPYKQYAKPFGEYFRRKRGKFELPLPIKKETVDLFAYKHI